MKRKILVIEDDASTREILREWLELNGYEVITAEDGYEGIMLLKKYAFFDLVITDFRMPKMTGIQVIQWIKIWIKQRYPNIKTILITGDDMRLVKDASADKIIAKPFDFAKLKKTINNLLYVH